MEDIPDQTATVQTASAMDTDTPFADMAPGAALFFIVIAVLALIYVVLRERRQRQLIAMFLERGQVVPTAILPRTGSRYGELRRGAWLAALGLGIGITCWLLTRELRYAAWGVIPLCLGLASFLNAALFYPRNDPQP